MYSPVYTKQFEKDLKLAKRRGKKIEKFKTVAETLLAGLPLSPLYRDHQLTGNYVGRRDCHIESDWVLVYKIEGVFLIFERMGTHSDLFKK